MRACLQRGGVLEDRWGLLSHQGALLLGGVKGGSWERHGAHSSGKPPPPAAPPSASGVSVYVRGYLLETECVPPSAMVSGGGASGDEEVTGRSPVVGWGP